MRGRTTGSFLLTTTPSHHCMLWACSVGPCCKCLSAFVVSALLILVLTECPSPPLPPFFYFSSSFLSLTHAPSPRHLSSPCSCLCALSSQLSGEMRMDRRVLGTTRCSLLIRVFRAALLFLKPKGPWAPWPGLLSVLSRQIREQDFPPGSETQPKAERCCSEQGLSAASLLQCFSRELTEPWQVSIL